MPIKPENRTRYPSNWRAIRAAILDRAVHCCEGSPAYPGCRAPNGWFRNKRTEELSNDPITIETWDLADEDPVTRIVLTIAHLDHTPENCDPANLRAWCQRCHLHYDKDLHASNSYATRRAVRAAGELF